MTEYLWENYRKTTTLEGVANYIEESLLVKPKAAIARYFSTAFSSNLYKWWYVFALYTISSLCYFFYLGQHMDVK